MLKPPQKTEYHQFYQTYVSNVSKENDILKYLDSQRVDFINLMHNLPNEKQEYKYAPEKWTIKELLRHIIDAESVFAFRAFTISKNTGVELPGMDQDEYVAGTDDTQNSFVDLLNEFDIQRQHNIAMIKNLHESKLNIIGNANDTPVSVRANIFIIAGHTAHHIEILKERYLTHV
jgi:hypothetical protein